LCIQTNKPAINRNVLRRLFHRWIEVVVPQLREVNSQYHLDWKRPTTRLRGWGVTLNHSRKPGPWDEAIHLLQKKALTRFFVGRLKAIIGKGSLFRCQILSSHGLQRPCFADFR
jgi:hypothetical protein